MFSSFLDTLLKVSKTTSPRKPFAYDCVTLYILSYISWSMFDLKVKISSTKIPYSNIARVGQKKEEG